MGFAVKLHDASGTPVLQNPKPPRQAQPRSQGLSSSHSLEKETLVTRLTHTPFWFRHAIFPPSRLLGRSAWRVIRTSALEAVPLILLPTRSSKTFEVHVLKSFSAPQAYYSSNCYLLAVHLFGWSQDGSSQELRDNPVRVTEPRDWRDALLSTLHAHKTFENGIFTLVENKSNVKCPSTLAGKLQWRRHCQNFFHLCFRKTQAAKSHHYLDVIVFEKTPFSNGFPSMLKSKAGVFPGLKSDSKSSVIATNYCARKASL